MDVVTDHSTGLFVKENQSDQDETNFHASRLTKWPTRSLTVIALEVHCLMLMFRLVRGHVAVSHSVVVLLLQEEHVACLPASPSDYQFQRRALAFVSVHHQFAHPCKPGQRIGVDNDTVVIWEEFRAVLLVERGMIHADLLADHGRLWGSLRVTQI